jgi:cold shock CspA family protein
MKPNGRLGTVKFYDPTAGFGFIACDAGADIYFHSTSIIETSRLPTGGARVKFIAGLSRNGRPIARNVAVLQTVGSRN